MNLGRISANKNRTIKDELGYNEFMQGGSIMDYAVFKCFGNDGYCLGETWSKFYKEFIPQTGYSQTDDTDYEIYFENGEKGLFCELWVPVTKDEKLN